MKMAMQRAIFPASQRAPLCIWRLPPKATRDTAAACKD